MNTCACGCGKLLPDNDNVEQQFIHGHNNRLRMLADKICEVCGQSYHPLSAGQRYCSRSCYNVVRSQGQRKRVQRICEVCGKPFEAKAYRSGSRFCSDTCRKRRNPPSEISCRYCGRSFLTYNRDALFCSRSCSRKDKTGEKATAWKGGKSLDHERARLSGELQEWRKVVYERDDYTCRQCGARGDIHAHHIKGFADYPELRFVVTNGLTLCIACHEALHGRKLSTPSQYPKHCIDCGCETKGRAWRCRACGRAHAHLLAGHKQPKTCPQCGRSFVKRAESVYCSTECARSAGITLAQVACAHCGRLIERSTSQIASHKEHFCSESCQHAHLCQRVSVTCPICSTTFEVKPYRLQGGRTPTCSLSCARKLVNQRRAAVPVS